jgi:hypothetical protein
MDTETAHQFSKHNKESLSQSETCGCFYCLRIMKATEINHYIEAGDEDTATCPYCDVDSILASKDVPLTEKFLKEMNKKWFGHID